MSSTRMKVVATLLAGVTLAGTAAEALAKNNRYTGTDITGYNRTNGYRGGGYHRGYRRGIGPGALAAGAALGVAGAAIAGAAGADGYYNGYRAYPYGEPSSGYGYDYLPGRGYYGPY